MVVADRAAGGERVVEPEAVLARDRVGGVRERRGALVGGDHQVGVVAVERAHLRRVHDLAVDQVVGDVQQRADVGLVLALDLGLELLAVGRDALDDEAALGAGGHDHGVLGQLRPHQAVDLGAVVHPVAPADPAAGDLAAAQVDALHLGRVDVDLVQRRRLRHRGHVGGAQLEGGRGAAVLEGARAQRRVDQRQLVAQDAVVVERDHRLEVGEDLVAQAALGGLVALARGVEAGLEVAHELGRQGGVGHQHVVLVALGEARAHALAVLAVGAQDRELAAVQARGDDEPVERVALGVAAPDGRDHLGHAGPARLDVQRRAVGAEDAELLHPDLVLLAGQARGELLQHPQPEVLEHRHRLGELDLGALLVQAHARLLAERLHRDDVPLPRRQAAEAGDVVRGRVDRRVALVVAREAVQPGLRQPPAGQRALARRAAGRAARRPRCARARSPRPRARAAPARAARPARGRGSARASGRSRRARGGSRPCSCRSGAGTGRARARPGRRRSGRAAASGSATRCGRRRRGGRAGAPAWCPRAPAASSARRAGPRRARRTARPSGRCRTARRPPCSRASPRSAPGPPGTGAACGPAAASRRRARRRPWS